MKRMQWFIYSALAVCAAILIGQFAIQAQVAPAQSAGQRGRWAQQLNLTDAQKTQLRAIRAQAVKDVRAVLTPAQQQQLKQDMGQTREKRVERMAQVLNLTPDQQTRVKAIRADAQAKVDAVKQNAALSDTEKFTQLQAIRKDTRAQIMQVLTPAQQQQLQQRAPGARRGQIRGFVRQEINSLKVTPEQQSKIKAIFQQARADARQVLTPEQQQQIDKFRAAHQHGK